MKMKHIHKRWAVGLVIVAVWSLLGGAAQAAGIPEVDRDSLFPLAQPSGVTLVVLDELGNDITATWLPEPGKTITVRLVTAAGAQQVPTALELLPATTKYPGVCTNTGDPQDDTYDYELLPNAELAVKDCGGRAVLRVNGNHDFVLPADKNLNGLPDLWEQQESAKLPTQNCPDPQACFSAQEDNEQTGANLFSGDGVAAIDEYRGFMVSGVHIRTSLTTKDVFVGLVNPQCRKVSGTTAPTGGETDSLLGKAAGDGRLIYPTDGTTLFANLGTLGGAKLHLLNYQPGQVQGPGFTEWVDNLAGFTDGQLQFAAGTDGQVSDRQVNRNAIAPLDIHKGIRIIECVDNAVFSPLGFALFPPGTQVGHPNEDTNSILYTQRIWHDYERVLSTAGKNGAPSAFKNCALAVSPTCVFYQTYEHGFANNGSPKTTTTTPVKTYTKAEETTVRNVDRNYIVSKYIQYLLAMEVGHSVALVPEIQIAEYGAHFAPGSGDNLDQRIVVKDSSKTGGVIYTIPSAYSAKSNNCFQLKPSTGVVCP